MIGLLRIAPRHSVQRAEGQLGLECQNRPGMRGGIGLVFAGQNQHMGDMGPIVAAQFQARRVGLEIIVAVRQTHAALIGDGDHGFCVLGVLSGAEAEQGLDTGAVEGADHRPKPCFVADRVDLLQQRLQRPKTALLDACLIHTGGVEIADLLRIRGRLGCRFFQNRAQFFLVPQRQHMIQTPAGFVGGDGVGVDPAAAGIAEEVAARVGFFVHHLMVDAGVVRARRRQIGGVGRGRQPGGECHGKHQTGEDTPRFRIQMHANADLLSLVRGGCNLGRSATICHDYRDPRSMTVVAGGLTALRMLDRRDNCKGDLGG